MCIHWLLYSHWFLKLSHLFCFLIICWFPDVPKLSPLPGLDKPEIIDDEEEEYEEDSTKPKKKRPSSGPKVQDPYATDDTSSMMLPVLVAIGAFIPLVFCLCKL